jgi:hypothetical protein
MKRYILSLLFLLSVVSVTAAVTTTAEGSGYDYKGSEATTGSAGVKSLIIMVVLGVGAFFATKWIKKNGFSMTGANPAVKTTNITEKKIAVDKKIITYETESFSYILGITKDNIILIDKIVRKQGKAKK